MSLLVCSAVFFPMTAAIVGYLIGRKDKDGMSSWRSDRRAGLVGGDGRAG